MNALVRDSVAELAQVYDFSPFHHLMDVGGALGTLSMAVLRRYPYMTATIFDLPVVKPLAEEHLTQHTMSDRIQVVAGNFFKDNLPRGADVITLGYILDDWSDTECLVILQRCFEALEPGGTILILEKVLNDDRTGPLFTALMNLNMLVVLPGRERTMSEYATLLTTTGFVEPGMTLLAGIRDVVYARKP